MYKKIFSIFVFLLIASLSFALGVQESQGNEIGNVNAQNVDSINQQTHAQARVRVKDGTHVGEGGQMLKVQTQKNNKIKLEVGGVSADCGLNVTQKQIQNKTRLETKLSNGKNTEIKVMPNTASERALERLRLKVCSEENECQIELKEVGSGEKIKLAYELKTQRQSKVLGLFRARMQVQAQVDAETGEIIKVKKPWWAFLATEPAEE